MGKILGLIWGRRLAAPRIMRGRKGIKEGDIGQRGLRAMRPSRHFFLDLLLVDFLLVDLLDFLPDLVFLFADISITNVLCMIRIFKIIPISPFKTLHEAPDALKFHEENFAIQPRLRTIALILIPSRFTRTISDVYEACVSNGPPSSEL